MIEKKVKKLAQHPKVDGVFVTSETDNPKNEPPASSNRG